VTTPLVGYAVVFDVPSGILVDHQGRRHRLIVSPGALDGWIGKGLGCPLLVHHAGIITSRGVQPDVGAARAFRADSFGVLCRAELDEDDPVANGVLNAVRCGDLWGMSWGVATLRQDPPEVPEHPSPLVVPTVRLLEAGVGEVTLTDRPGFCDARILAVGDEADWLWSYPDLAAVALAARTAPPSPEPRSRAW